MTSEAVKPVFSRETLAQVRAAGVEQLLEQHYREIAHNQDIPLAVDWAAYEVMEQAGILRIFTLRVGGQLVGYACHIVTTNPHYSGSLQAAQDVLYVDLAWRRGHLGMQLISYADNQLAREGVQAVYQHQKIAHEALGVVLPRLGYQPVELVWTRRLDRSPLGGPAR